MKEPKYLPDQEKISHTIKNGIIRLLETDEERTKIETPKGTYIFPTKEFNRLRGNYQSERTISSLTGLGVALDLRYPEKPEKLNYPEPD